MFEAYYKIYIDRFSGLKQEEKGPFFLNFQKTGTLSSTQMGVHTVGKLGKDVAAVLNLENPALYTGHYLEEAQPLR